MVVSYLQLGVRIVLTKKNDENERIALDGPLESWKKKVIPKDILLDWESLLAFH